MAKTGTRKQKIYIRAGMSPLEPVPIGEAIERNLFGGNTGNLIYQYSVFRALMGPDTEFVARDFMDVDTLPGGVSHLNETCDCAILTLANAFRPRYPIGQMADFVRALKIPCVVVGCGVQADSYAQLKDPMPFDDDVRRFVDAVLDRSAMLGLRGEFTAEYLKRLGYAPERHFTVIGCPSFFLHGPDMPAPRLSPIGPDTRVSMNTRPTQRPEMHRLLYDAQRQFTDWHMVLQRERELRMIALGIPHRVPRTGRDTTGYYPFSQRHSGVRSGRIVGFTEARTWFKYFRDIDLSFGSRIHGNIAAVLSGVPAFVFTPDTRTEELCRFGNIPFMPMAELKADTDLRALLERADFEGVLRGHRQRFEHYVDFLDKNGVWHIYRQGAAPDAVPFDEAMARVPAGGCVRCGCVGPGETLMRNARIATGKIKTKLRRYRRRLTEGKFETTD